jgi:integrase
VRINYVADSGKKKQLTRSVYGLDVAKDLECRLEHEIKVRHEMPVRKMTLGQLYDEYISVKSYEVRESTLYRSKKIFRVYIIPVLGDTRIHRLSANVLQDWKISVEKRNLSLETRHNIYGQLRAILNYAVKMEYLPKNPLLKVGNFKDSMAFKKEICFYTADEFRKYIDIAKMIALEKQEKENNLYEWNYYVFFNIAFYTGLRKGEIHGLRWNDISKDYLSVNRSVTQKLRNRGDLETPPKNRSSIRTIQIPLPLIKILNEHKERQKKLQGFCEGNRILGDGYSLRDTTIQNRNKLYSSLAGVKRIRIHDFRHSHASLLANMSINIQEIARRLGHAKIEMTWNVYAHLYPKEEEKAIAVLNTV